MIYLELFITFFKIGAFTFGGGYAMLPLIIQEVTSKSWLAYEELINFVAVSESTPGPFAINISTYIGTTLAGIPGGICATLGVVMPSFIIILIVANVFERFKENKYVKGAMIGLKAVVVGLIGAAIYSIGKTVFIYNGFEITMFICALVIFVLMGILTIKKVHPIIVIVISAILGVTLGFIFKLPL